MWPGHLRSMDLNNYHASHNVSLEPCVKTMMADLASWILLCEKKFLVNLSSRVLKFVRVMAGWSIYQYLASPMREWGNNLMYMFSSSLSDPPGLYEITYNFTKRLIWSSWSIPVNGFACMSWITPFFYHYLLLVVSRLGWLGKSPRNCCCSSLVLVFLHCLPYLLLIIVKISFVSLVGVWSFWSWDCKAADLIVFCLAYTVIKQLYQHLVAKCIIKVKNKHERL